MSRGDMPDFSGARTPPRWVSFVGTTDANGNLPIAYPVAYPAGTTPIPVVCLGDASGAYVRVLNTSRTNLGFTVVVNAANGAVVANGAVRVNYTAG